MFFFNCNEMFCEKCEDVKTGKEVNEMMRGRSSYSCARRPNCLFINLNFTMACSLKFSSNNALAPIVTFCDVGVGVFFQVLRKIVS